MTGTISEAWRCFGDHSSVYFLTESHAAFTVAVGGNVIARGVINEPFGATYGFVMEAETERRAMLDAAARLIAALSPSGMARPRG